MTVGSIGSIAQTPKAPMARRAQPAGTFAAELSQRLNQQAISVSVHAADRMARRGIEMTPQTVEQLGGAFDLAESKGAKKALFLLNDLAVIASVKDRMVMTALDRERLVEGVFTNIDTAVVVSSEQGNNKSTVNITSERRSSTEGARMNRGGINP